MISRDPRISLVVGAVLFATPCCAGTAAYADANSETAPAALATESGASTTAAADADAAGADAAGGLKSEKLKTLPDLSGPMDGFQKLVYSAVIITLERDGEMEKIDRAVDKLKAPVSKGGEKTGKAMQYLLSYKGVALSHDGASALLEKNVSLESLMSAQLKWEKVIDETYLKIVRIMMQMATAMGSDTYADSAAYKTAHSELSRMVGDEKAAVLAGKLAEMRKDASVTSSQFAGSLLPPIEYVSRLEKIEIACGEDDPVTRELIFEVGKYADVDMEKVKLSGIVQGGLGILGMIPGFTSPLAQIASTAYVAATGGSEEEKLLYSVYVYKRLEVRRRTIHEAAELAMRNYELSQLTRNPMQRAFSASLVRELAGQATADAVLGSG